MIRLNNCSNAEFFYSAIILLNLKGGIMKKVLCYGDSNTFGYNTINASRFDENTRWTALLQKNLGAEYEVINEGMCDRTGFVDNDKGSMFSAQRHFPELISETPNIDILILAVGTNDLQFKYNITFSQIESGLEKLIVTAKNKVNKIIIVPPVVLSENVLDGSFNFQFDETSISKSKEAGKIYGKLARMYNCEVFDINDFVKPSQADGLHYDENGHKIIADKLSDYIKNRG